MPAKLKVLHLIDSGGLYGAEQALLTLAYHQKRQGLDTTILSAGRLGEPQKPIEVAAAASGIKIVPWRMKKGANFAEALKIVRWAKNEHFNLLHTHGYKFNILLGLLPRSLRSFAPLVSTFHGYTHEQLKSKFNIVRIANELSLHRFDTVVVLTPKMRHYSKNRIFIPNPLPDYLKEPSHPNQKSDKIAAYIGRLSKEKGIKTLIQAIAILKERKVHIELKIYGDGPQKAELSDAIEKHDLSSSISLEGYTEKPYQVLKGCKLFILPSHSENMPISIMEAMHAGCFIASTSVGAIPWMLEGYKKHYLSEPGDAEGLARNIELALRSKPGDSNLAEGKSPLKKFDPEEIVESYSDLYQELAKYNE